MGFARGFEINYGDPEFDARWPQIVGDARAIVDALASRGVVIRGGHGVGAPIITTGYAEVRSGGDVMVYERGAIWLNGARELDEDCETFLIAPTSDGSPVADWAKTQMEPYDLAVAAILLRMKALAPAAVRLPSADTSEPNDPSLDEGRALLADLGLTSGAS